MNRAGVFQKLSEQCNFVRSCISSTTSCLPSKTMFTHKWLAQAGDSGATWRSSAKGVGNLSGSRPYVHFGCATCAAAQLTDVACRPTVNHSCGIPHALVFPDLWVVETWCLAKILGTCLHCALSMLQVMSPLLVHARKATNKLWTCGMCLDSRVG